MPSRLRRLLAELRGRKVLNVAGVYLVAAWIVLQLGDIVIEPLGLPSWTMTLLIVLTAVGLGIAVVLSWFFDVKRAGIEWRGEIPGTSSRAPVFLGLAILATGVAAGTLAYVGLRPGGHDRGLDSVAVLPFVNLSDDPANEYFSDGITEELLDALGGVPELRVPARTSSFQFKGGSTDVREIGRMLNVQAVLEGSVRKANDRVRITVQLVNAETGYRIWSETYDRELRDIFALQAEIAAAIVDSLKPTLAADLEPPPGGYEAPHRIEAHDLYLLGRFHFHGRNLSEAERQFRAAIATDPDYAQAYAGLALTYAVLPLFDPGTTVEEAVREGKAAAYRALTLDPTLADAHAALGQIMQNYEWDWAAARGHYTRAIELAPNDPNARQWRAEVLVVHGDSDAARELEATLALDPLSPILNSVTALAHLLVSRDYHRSAELWRRVEDLDSRFPLLREFAVHTFIAQGDWDETRGRLFRLAASPADSQAFATWTDAAATVRRGGSLGMATRARVFEAADRYGRLSGLGLDEVGTAMLLGPVDPEAALEIIDGVRASLRHRQALTWLPRFWFFDRLHGDPRYQRLIRTLGLAP